ncbi:hypothetical protein HDZ31DRAFT_65222 [Schizophyllum fasciatum]
MYRETSINLDAYDFYNVVDLAEAAEKYVVFIAMAACSQYMKGQHKEYPLQVMRYAAAHNYPDIVDAAAPYTLGTSLFTIRQMLPSHYVLPWVLFNDGFVTLARTSMPTHTDRYHHHWDHDAQEQLACELDDPNETWMELDRRLAHQVLWSGGNCLLWPESFFAAEMALAVRPCGGCHAALTSWRTELMEETQQLLKKPFTQYL